MKKIQQTLTALFLLAFVTNYSSAQNASGDIDNNFYVAGTSNNGFNNVVYTSVIQSDGSAIVGGTFQSYKNVTCRHIARLDMSGSLDTAFTNHGGNGFNSSSTMYVQTIAIQQNGQIVVGGNFTSYGSNTNVKNIARINFDGTLDTPFSDTAGSNGFNGVVNAIAIQPNGKILVGGDFTQYQLPNHPVGRIVRLNIDGSIDHTFNFTGSTSNAGFNGTVNSIKVQSDGKILVGGDFTNYNGTAAVVNRLIRLDSIGNVDQTFKTNINLFGGFNGNIYDIELTKQNKIIVGGAFYKTNSFLTSNRIACLNQNGTFDTTFIPVNFGCTSSYVAAVEIQQDNKILIGGLFQSYLDKDNSTTVTSKLLRLNSDGTLDKSFNNNYTSPSFGGGTTNYVKSLSQYSNGKILVGGTFSSYNGNTKNKIVRLTNNIILTQNPVPTVFCVGESINVSFSILGTFAAGNIFKVQLSDSSGSFTNFTMLDSVTSDTAIAVSCNLPNTIPYGTHYRVRVISHSPSPPALFDYNLGSANEHDITVGNLASVSVTQNGNTLSANLLGAGITYQWFNCDLQIPIIGATNSTYLPLSNGNYRVKLSQASCVDSSTCVNVILTSLSSKELTTPTFLISPNPCSDCFINGSFNISDLRIIDMLGKNINVDFIKRENAVSFNVTNFDSGIYFVRNIKTGEAIKFIKN